ncbi:FtsH protease activity modulator HflK [Paradevosia shaoguanensis]|uniref:FtsH protease activity modulator HflK n=1 Tax=Paradevosia shaoguanensis TaxID=1335043 RepID=UPI0019321410|nr:FtsH protease activity modulator HflK [Paradevosia shaoguanensis]
MPWDNNTGGGGRNNNGGPWGQAPQGGGPRRGGTPNLEEILNRGRDSFQGGIPGGRWVLIGGLLAVGAFWLLNSVYTVDPQQVGVELRFGKPKPELASPGLHFMVWPIDSVEKVNVTENQTEIGSVPVSSRRPGARDEGTMLTSDQNIVDVKFSVLWSVANPIEYLFNVRDADDMVRSAGESAMREVVGRRSAQAIYREDRAGIQVEVQQITQRILDDYKLGVRVSQIAIENVAPPTEVADAFDEVQRAEQDQERFQEEARQYSNTLLGDARGQAAQMREDAAAYKNRVVQEAEGQASRFTSVYDEYAKAPEVTRERLFLETMEQVLGSSQKVIVDKGAGSGVVPYLPLPELRPNAGITPPANSSSTTPSAQGK